MRSIFCNQGPVTTNNYFSASSSVNEKLRGAIRWSHQEQQCFSAIQNTEWRWSCDQIMILILLIEMANELLSGTCMNGIQLRLDLTQNSLMFMFRNMKTRSQHSPVSLHPPEIRVECSCLKRSTQLSWIKWTGRRLPLTRKRWFWRWIDNIFIILS